MQIAVDFLLNVYMIKSTCSPLALSDMKKELQIAPVNVNGLPVLSLWWNCSAETNLIEFIFFEFGH